MTEGKRRHMKGSARHSARWRMADGGWRIRVACLLQAAISCHLRPDDDGTGPGILQLLLVLGIDQEAEVAGAGLAQRCGGADDQARISANTATDGCCNFAEGLFVHAAAQGTGF